MLTRIIFLNAFIGVVFMGFSECLYANVQHAKVLELVPGQNSTNTIGHYFQVMASAEYLPLQSAVENTAYQPITKPIVQLGYSKSYYWLTLRVKNSGAEAAKWLFSTSTRRSNLLEIYEIGANGKQRLLQHTGNDHQNDRPVAHRHLYVEINFAPLEEKQIYIQLQSDFGIRADYRFLTQDSFISLQRQDYFALGLFLACMLTLTLVNLFHYFATFQSLYLYYVVMVIFNILTITQHDGFNFRYLWPKYPYFDQIMTSIFTILAMLLMMQVFRHAMNFRRIAPLFDKSIAVFMLFLSCAIPVTFIDYQLMAKMLTSIATPTSFIILTIASIISVRNKIESAYFYLTGWLAHATATSAFFLMYMGVNIFTFVENTIYIYATGILLEAILFSMAIAHKVRILFQKHKVAQKEQIQLLEDRLTDMAIINNLEKEKNLALAETQQKILHLASTSHDVFQPLYAIRAALTTVNEKELNSESITEMNAALDYAEGILKASMNDSRSSMRNHSGLVSLGKVFNELFRQSYRNARDNNLILRFCPTMLYVVGSKIMLLRILDNLIKNALRYTKKGKIICGVRRRKNSIEIQVLDTGPGLSASNIERILTPFCRGNISPTDTSGYGLGLNIVKTLCDEQGYQFKIQSEVGKGSVFSVIMDSTTNR